MAWKLNNEMKEKDSYHDNNLTLRDLENSVNWDDLNIDGPKLLLSSIVCVAVHCSKYHQADSYFSKENKKLATLIHESKGLFGVYKPLTNQFSC